MVAVCTMFIELYRRNLSTMRDIKTASDARTYATEYRSRWVNCSGTGPSFLLVGGGVDNERALTCGRKRRHISQGRSPLAETSCARAGAVSTRTAEQNGAAGWIWASRPSILMSDLTNPRPPGGCLRVEKRRSASIPSWSPPAAVRRPRAERRMSSRFAWTRSGTPRAIPTSTSSRRPSGQALPQDAPGRAHRCAPATGSCGNLSLLAAQPNPTRYTIAVKRSPASRGGSRLSCTTSCASAKTLRG